MSLAFVRASSLYVALPANGLLNNVSSACLCGWVNHASNNAGANDRIISIGMSNAADNSRAGIGIRAAGGNLYMAGRTATGDPGGVINSTAICPLSTWTHILVNISFTGVTASFYLNGTFVDTVAGDWTAGNTENVNSLAGAIGASANGARFYMDGTLDDVRFYNRSLSANEAQVIFACKGSDAIFYGLCGRYNLKERQTGYTTLAGSVVRDYCGNLSGTAVAGCVYADSTLKSRRLHQ